MFQYFTFHASIGRVAITETVRIQIMDFLFYFVWNVTELPMLEFQKTMLALN